MPDDLARPLATWRDFTVQKKALDPRRDARSLKRLMLRRQKVWLKLRALGDEGIDAFAVLLRDEDLEVRRSAALTIIRDREDAGTAALQSMQETSKEARLALSMWKKFKITMLD